MSTADKEYLFVSGCPRSGTTALWRLLASHPDVVMGVERYSNLISKNWSLSPAHFEKDRFMDVQEGDTFYGSIEHFPAKSGMRELHYSSSDKFETCRYVGDKLPYLYNRLQPLSEAFPGAHVVYILREISDVALSFDKRLKNPKDRWKQSAADAVNHWGQSMRKIVSAPEDLNIHIVIYEDLFGEKPEYAYTLFERLGLPITQDIETVIAEALRTAARLRIRRRVSSGRDLDTSLLEAAPMHLYEQLKKNAIR